MDKKSGNNAQYIIKARKIKSRGKRKPNQAEYWQFRDTGTVRDCIITKEREVNSRWTDEGLHKMLDMVWP